MNNSEKTIEEKVYPVVKGWVKHCMYGILIVEFVLLVYHGFAFHFDNDLWIAHIYGLAVGILIGTLWMILNWIVKKFV